jgi:hypothetical protein
MGQFAVGANNLGGPAMAIRCFPVALVSAALSVMAGTARANLLVNGSFEDPAFPADAIYIHLLDGELPGWTSFSTYRGTVLFSTVYDPVTDGAQAVQIEVPGDYISQNFSTTVGAHYRLSLDLSAYSGYGGPGLGRAPCPCESLLDVSVGGSTATFASSSLGFVSETLDFVADSSTTTVQLMNPSIPSAYGNYPHIDNVSVVAIPEPETYALMAAGIGLLAAVARRRMRAA